MCQREISRKRKKKEALERKLLQEGYDKSSILRDGKEILANRTIQLLQTRILHIYLNIKQQQLDVSRLADSSKKRIKLRRSIAANTTMLDCNIDRYNAIIHLSKEPLSSIGKADALDGKFSWHLSSGMMLHRIYN